MPARLAIVLTLLLVGCAATPPAAYYTLAPTATVSDASSHQAIGVALDDFPEALDRSEIMVRTGPNRLSVTELHRWAGPLKRQFLRTLTENLVRLTGSRNIAFAPWDERFEPQLRISIALLQFDGAPDCQVTLRARWSIADADGSNRRIHASELCQVAGPDYPDLVMTQNRLIERLAREIATALDAQ